MLKKHRLSGALGLLLLATNLVAETTIFDDGENSVYIKGWGDLRMIDTQGQAEVVDGVSRININFKRTLTSGWEAFLVTETGFNLAGSTAIAFAGGDTFQTRRDDLLNLRLGYVGIEHEGFGKISMGKQWGVYYSLAENTDYGHSFAGTASGVYNYNGDGGLSGSGRAEKAIQYTNQFGMFRMALQIQLRDVTGEIDSLDPTSPPGEQVDSLKFDNSYGATLGFELGENDLISVAYNASDVDVTFGDGSNLFANDRISAIAYTHGKYGDGWYFAFNYNEAEFHEVDNFSRIIEESRGIELYTSYQAEGSKWMPYFQYNDLEADDSYAASYNGDVFNRAFYLLGINYYWTDKTEMYFDVRIDDSTITDPGQAALEDDSVGLGMRFYF